MCVLSRRLHLFPLLLAWSAVPPSCSLSSALRPPPRLLGYFYNDTLCNVNYCRRNELEKVFQDAALQHFSRSLLSRYIRLRCRSLFHWLVASECQRAPLSSFSGRIPRESPHFHGADLVKGFMFCLARSRLVSASREAHFYFFLPELDGTRSLRM